MSSLFYRFRSTARGEYERIAFDGPSITVSELREAIMEKNQMPKSRTHILEFTNAQTKELYELESSVISKNSCVIVKRMPVKRQRAGDKNNDKTANREGNGNGKVKEENGDNGKVKEENDDYGKVKEENDDCHTEETLEGGIRHARETEQTKSALKRENAPTEVEEGSPKKKIRIDSDEIKPEPGL